VNDTTPHALARSTRAAPAAISFRDLFIIFFTYFAKIRK
jgi:hypothetical protein